ncbi:MAG: PD-(D/E)XK nuclease family protein [Candidatus Dormibacteraeota bacterium]|nr:PD-(D/E)XK nuclease family protein [Thermoproteota archaeon]MDQ6879331.1 PD-(D/E)XK nuclease family protein [Candidatus Dormibacteraeota bacterium]
MSPARQQGQVGHGASCTLPLFDFGDMATCLQETAPLERVIEYSPSGASTLRFCQRKYYFRWLMRRRQAWRKESTDHPWRRVQLLNSVKHLPNWAGDLFHQSVAHLLNQQLRGRTMDLDEISDLAVQAAAAQFTFSARRHFVGATKSKVGTINGISRYLALFEHVYDLPFDGDALAQTQQKLAQWLGTLFAWSGWEPLLQQVRTARRVYVEPQHLYYRLAEARIAARMDLGIDSRTGEFLIWDWKCYREDDRFAEYDQFLFRQQLLAYGLWPVLRSDGGAITLDRVSAQVFNPVTGEDNSLSFSDDEHSDFELEVGRWARAHAEVFTDVAEVEFEDFEGPRDTQQSCPWCPLKGVCGEDIAWATLS